MMVDKRLFLRRLFAKLIVNFLLVISSGCFTILYTRSYEAEGFQVIGEWSVSPILNAYALQTREEIREDKGLTPEQYHQYRIGYWVAIEDSIYLQLSQTERNDIFVDSIQISFPSYQNTVVFSDSIISDKKMVYPIDNHYLAEYQDTINIPLEIAAVKMVLYGKLRNAGYFYQPFKIEEIMVFKDRKISAPNFMN